MTSVYFERFFERGQIGNGKRPRMKLISMNDGSKTALLAESELRKYVSRCAGTDWQHAEYVLETTGGKERANECERGGGYRWTVERRSGGVTVRLSGGSSADLLHGVYAFAESYLGVRFTMMGDAAGVPASCPERDGREEKTPFGVRGTLPWHNFLCGPSGWNENDYFLYVESLAKLRCNLVMFHVYTGGLERYWPYVEPLVKIGWMGVEPSAQFDTTATARWGYVPRKTSEFGAGTQAWFDSEEFGSDLTVGIADRGMHYVRSASMLRRLIDYAHERGIQVALGFEPGIVPPEIHSVLPTSARLDNLVLDPCHPATKEIVRNTFEYIAEQYPDIDYVVLWQHEHACMSHHMPKPGTPFAEFCRERENHFAYIRDEERRMDACWALATFSHAYEEAKALLPNANVVLSGWGGGEQFPLLLRGLNETLPRDIVFSCLAPSLGELDGPEELFALRGRDVWVIPWFEGDHQLWHPQPRLFTLERQIRQAEEKGVSGVLAIHWRIRDIHDQFAFFGRRLWDRALSPESYYHEAWIGKHPELPAEAVALLISMDKERWFAGAASYEFYGFEAGWGRLDDAAVSALSRLVGLLDPVSAPLGSPLHQLKHMIDFSLRFHRCTQTFRELETYKSRLLAVADQEHASRLAEEALAMLDSVDLTGLLLAYASKIDQSDDGPAKRGELGVLSSINQRVLAYAESMRRYLETYRMPLRHRNLSFK